MSLETLENYFEEKVFEADENQGLNLPPEVLYYLKTLLTSYAYNFPNKKLYLCDIYEQSINSDSKEDRFRNFKTLGDYSLVTSGFFSESLRGGIADINYYIDMGSSAYANISDCPGPFYELSIGYKNCVSVLNEVSESNRNYSINDIGRLYEFWYATGSVSVRKKLYSLGMLNFEIKE